MTTLQISLSDKNILAELNSYLLQLKKRSPLEFLEIEEISDTEFLSKNINIKKEILVWLSTPLSECDELIVF